MSILPGRVLEHEGKRELVNFELEPHGDDTDSSSLRWVGLNFLWPTGLHFFQGRSEFAFPFLTGRHKDSGFLNRPATPQTDRSEAIAPPKQDAGTVVVTLGTDALRQVASRGGKGWLVVLMSDSGKDKGMASCHKSLRLLRSVTDRRITNDNAARLGGSSIR